MTGSPKSLLQVAVLGGASLLLAGCPSEEERVWGAPPPSEPAAVEPLEADELVVFADFEVVNERADGRYVFVYRDLTGEVCRQSVTWEATAYRGAVNDCSHCSGLLAVDTGSLRESWMGCSREEAEEAGVALSYALLAPDADGLLELGFVNSGVLVAEESGVLGDDLTLEDLDLDEPPTHVGYVRSTGVWRDMGLTSIAAPSSPGEPWAAFWLGWAPGSSALGSGEHSLSALWSFAL